MSVLTPTKEESPVSSAGLSAAAKSAAYAGVTKTEIKSIASIPETTKAKYFTSSFLYI